MHRHPTPTPVRATPPPPSGELRAAAATAALDAELADLRERLAQALPECDVGHPIGRGGAGAVFRARQRRLERDVAIKVLLSPEGGVPGWNERFEREARALAKLSHPGIVTVHDFGSRDGLVWIVMELVEGTNLRELLREGRLAPAEALAIVPQLCSALEYAHERGVVHRDIKPENVLLDTNGAVKLADFGLAKLREGERANLTREDQAMGTPRYMAPEQLERPLEVDHRADIFSLGVVFYEMLTGQVPAGVVEPPSHRVQVDVRLDRVVLRALEREPTRRYQRARELETDVREAQASKTQAQPVEQREAEPALGEVRGGWSTVDTLVVVTAGLMALTDVWLGPDQPVRGLAAVGALLLAIPVSTLALGYFEARRRRGGRPGLRFSLPLLRLGVLAVAAALVLLLLQNHVEVARLSSPEREGARSGAMGSILVGSLVALAALAVWNSSVRKGASIQVLSEANARFAQMFLAPLGAIAGAVALHLAVDPSAYAGGGLGMSANRVALASASLLLALAGLLPLGLLVGGHARLSMRAGLVGLPLLALCTGPLGLAFAGALPPMLVAFSALFALELLLLTAQLGPGLTTHKSA